IVIVVGRIQHFFAIGTDTKTTSCILDNRTIFLFFQIVHPDGTATLVDQHILDRSIQTIICCWQWNCNNAVSDVFKIDRNSRSLWLVILFVLVRRLLIIFLGYLILGGIAFLL